MAEYINRELAIEEWYKDSNLHKSAETMFKELPTADVIERAEFEEMVKSFKAMVAIKDETLIDMRDKYYTLEKEYAELKININKAIKEMDSIDLNEYADNAYQLVNKCIEILKRNIGD